MCPLKKKQSTSGWANALFCSYPSADPFLQAEECGEVLIPAGRLAKQELWHPCELSCGSRF
jgi:hypothetical protein